MSMRAFFCLTLAISSPALRAPSTANTIADADADADADVDAEMMDVASLIYKYLPANEAALVNGQKSGKYLWNTAEKVGVFYRKYADELKNVAEAINYWCDTFKKSCISTEMEMELLYMRIREAKPRMVLELCPNMGYSTQWILYALRANNDGGALYSYDFHSAPEPKAFFANLTAGKPGDKAIDYRHFWGDMYESFQPSMLKDNALAKVDMVFVDGGHSREQAQWFLNSVFGFLLDPKKQGEPVSVKARRDVLVSVHDTYNKRYTPGGMTRADPSTEGALTVEFVALNSHASNGWEWTALKDSGKHIQPLADERERALAKKCGVGKKTINNIRNWCDVLTFYFELSVPDL